jgi:hypothetical protein
MVMKHTYFRWGMVLLMFLWGLRWGSATAVYACTPPVGGLPQYTAAERTNAATIVLEGTVTEGRAAEGYAEGIPQGLTVEVQQYLKGSGPAVVMIDGFGTSALCLYEAHLGDHLIFYAEGDPETGLHAHYLSQFDAAEAVSPEVIAEITAVTGQSPTQPTTNAPAPLINKSSANVIMAILLIVVVLGVGVWVWRRRR